MRYDCKSKNCVYVNQVDCFGKIQLDLKIYHVVGQSYN